MKPRYCSLCHLAARQPKRLHCGSCVRVGRFCGAQDYPNNKQILVLSYDEYREEKAVR